MYSTADVAMAVCRRGSFGESDLGRGSGSRYGSSLDDFQKGRLGSENQGPLDDVFFDFDSSDLGSRARETLEVNSQWLRSNPNHLLLIEGHCDERGTNEYNLALGERRAKSAMNYLVSQGVQASRITIISYGEERPACTEKNEECWSRNRRAHFLVKPR